MTNKISDLDLGERVDLAHEKRFILGGAEVRPATREVVWGNQREVLEPRVMQGLVALARAGGEVVARDDLINAAWEGRVVSEDAINRVISRVRRVGEVTGAFALETVTKVGYRLVTTDPQPGLAAAPAEATAMVAQDAPLRIPRRLLIGGGGLALGAAVIGAELWRRSRPNPASKEVEDLLRRGVDALRQGTPESSAQAIAFFKQCTVLAPTNADAWGGLALSYALAMHNSPSSEALSLETRAQAAAARSLQLDAGSRDAVAATAILGERAGDWSAYGAALATGLRKAPDHPALLEYQTFFLACTGQTLKAVECIDKAIAVDAFTPRFYAAQSWMLWSVGRIDESEAVLRRSRELWPRFYWTWFNLFWLLAYSGRVPAAIAMSREITTRPVGIPSADFDLIELNARALDSRSAADIRLVHDQNLAAARRGDGYATNAYMIFSALGLLDEAFGLARGVLLKEGNLVGAGHFSQEQGQSDGHNAIFSDRLFHPPVAAMRADPRFETLVTDLGLTAYWRQAHVTPDYKVRR